jgi:hypothetical protein
MGTQSAKSIGHYISPHAALRAALLSEETLSVALGEYQLLARTSAPREDF